MKYSRKNNNRQTISLPNLAGIVCLLGVAIFSSGCEKVPPITELDHWGIDPVTHTMPAAPIMVVGQIVGHAELGRPRPARERPTEPVQLYRLTVQIENVLQGEATTGRFLIYYFASVGSSGGPAQLNFNGKFGAWDIGDRKIFWLRQDRATGVLRTNVDNWAVCVTQVLTGAHPGYRRRPGETIDQAIVDILLTRGEGCSDRDLIASISSSGASSYDPRYAVRKLQYLAEHETPDVRRAAQAKLQQLRVYSPQAFKELP